VHQNRVDRPALAQRLDRLRQHRREAGRAPRETSAGVGSHPLPRSSIAPWPDRGPPRSLPTSPCTVARAPCAACVASMRRLHRLRSGAPLALASKPRWRSSMPSIVQPARSNPATHSFHSASSQLADRLIAKPAIEFPAGLGFHPPNSQESPALDQTRGSPPSGLMMGSTNPRTALKFVRIPAPAVRATRRCSSTCCSPASNRARGEVDS
jgi:hypothetical protein